MTYPAPNPYAPPTTRQDPVGSPHDAVAAGKCPRCGSSNVHDPSFTWWGGALGPKLFHHRVCRDCRLGYDKRTGTDNMTKIIVYQVVVGALVLALFIARWSR